MNMFVANKASSIDEYLRALPDDRKPIVEYLHRLIPTLADNLTPYFATNMLGYGSFAYKNFKKQTIDWPIVALANQKNYLSLYVCALDNGQYLAEKFQDKLGNVSVGKSCIRFKKLEDLNLETLKQLILEAASNPGL